MSRKLEILRFFPLYLLAAAVPVSVSVSGIAVGLVILTALGLAISHGKEFQFPSRPVALALFSLIGVYFLATLFSSPYPHNWYKLFEEMWFKLLLLAIPILVGNRSELVIRLVKIAIFFGFLAGLFAVWQHFSEFDPIRNRSLVRSQWEHAAVTGFFSHHLSFAGQALIFFILTFSWLLVGPVKRAQAWLPVALLVMGAALMWSYARSAFLGAAAGVIALIVLVSGWRRWAGLTLLGSGVAGALLLPSVRAHLLMLFEMKRHVTRINLWESSWHGIQARPILGFGPGNFESLLAEHQVDGYYETLAHSHNDLLMHGVNGGVPAMIAAAALLAVTCRIFWVGWKRCVPGSWILLGALAVQAGITVAGFFQVFQTDDEVEILLYFILGCALALAGCSGASPDQKEAGI